jgi:hypothetical protein
MPDEFVKKDSKSRSQCRTALGQDPFVQTQSPGALSPRRGARN